MAVELYLGRATKRYTHAVCCMAYMHVAWCPLRSLRSLCQFVHRIANCHAAAQTVPQRCAVLRYLVRIRFAPPAQAERHGRCG